MHARWYYSFSFASDPDHHICELQLVHVAMLTARKQCNAHSAYSKFRSALELLETFGLSQDDAKDDAKEAWSHEVADGEGARMQDELAQTNEYARFLARYQIVVGITSPAATILSSPPVQTRRCWKDCNPRSRDCKKSDEKIKHSISSSLRYQTRSRIS